MQEYLLLLGYRRDPSCPVSSAKEPGRDRCRAGRSGLGPPSPDTNPSCSGISQGLAQEPPPLKCSGAACQPALQGKPHHAFPPPWLLCALPGWGRSRSELLSPRPAHPRGLGCAGAVAGSPLDAGGGAHSYSTSSCPEPPAPSTHLRVHSGGDRGGEGNTRPSATPQAPSPPGKGRGGEGFTQGSPASSASTAPPRLGTPPPPPRWRPPDPRCSLAGGTRRPGPQPRAPPEERPRPAGSSQAPHTPAPWGRPGPPRPLQVRGVAEQGGKAGGAAQPAGERLAGTCKAISTGRAAGTRHQPPPRPVRGRRPPPAPLAPPRLRC